MTQRGSPQSDFPQAAARAIRALYHLAPAGKPEMWDRGTLAALRRGIQSDDGWSANSARIVESWIDASWKLWDNERETLYWIAALFASHPYHQNGTRAAPETGENPKRYATFAKTLSDFAIAGAATTNASVDDVRAPLNRRFVALLDCEREDLFPKLRRMLVLLKATETPIDWTRLAFDINDWELESKRVQRQWARDWWNPRSNQGEPNTDVTAENASVAGLLN